MRRLRAHAATVALGVGALAGCATSGTVPGTDAPSAPGETTQATASSTPADPACPEVLPQPDPPEHGLGPSDPATSVPEFGAFDRAWTCEYVTSDTGETDPNGGALYGWVLAGGPVSVPEDELDEVAAALDTLAIPDPEQACTADLGPRYLLVIASGDDLTGAAIDDFGCRDVRLTDDPWTVAPGESTAPGIPAGVLQGDVEVRQLIEMAAS